LAKSSSLKKIFAACSIIIIILFSYHIYPAPIVNNYYHLSAMLARLEKKTIRIDGYTIHYYEGKKSYEKDTLLLLHGLGDDKNSFVLSAKNLSDKYNVILPDLLGHGENERINDVDYSIEAQAKMLRKLVQAKNIERLHLGGNSMGGHIALSYGTRYQEGLKSLILINAPGVKVDDHEVYKSYIDNIETEEDLNVILRKIFYKVPELPKPFKVYKIKELNYNRNFINTIVIPRIKNSEDFDLIDKLSNISTSTLILWGKHDEIVRYNVAEQYAKSIPNTTLFVMDQAAHSPQLEVPQEVSAQIDAFIKKLSGSKT